ncbi:site-specific integrase [Cupriavidus pauculus]|uniref:site-specific integrase n=1 Tax=Cupriavidus pauculus TaxID=82633 RepID=UPI001244ADB4|nr:site-specific integrase [Cupriavidus pauculus]KAB0601167.1 tyrosine-type recombinase/integrase [Cupriavidus pauculus]UAK99163.1 site-specific integrase [Cupriavidus pauculus]
MHITRRNGVYYFRKKIPADLVAIYGKREIIYSLRTKDRPMAARLALRAAVQLDDEFSLKRGEPVPPERIAVTPDQTAPLSTQGAAERRAPKSNKVTLACLIPIWRRENNPTDKTADAVARAVSEVGNPHIGTITRATVAAMRDRWLERGNTASTVTKKVGFIRLLLTVGRNRGLIESNPAEGMALPADTRAVELRQPFSTRQVTAILSATAEYRDTEPAKFWIPRLGYLTGARLNELCQLRTYDILNKEGFCGLQLTDYGEYMPGVPMTLKNAASRRWVPLHPSLNSFAEWAATLPPGPIFGLKPNKYGVVSDSTSKWFGKLLRAKLKIADSRLTFHSLRHGMADMLRIAGVADVVRHAILGHAEQGASGAYGSGDLPAPLLADCIGKLKAL